MLTVRSRAACPAALLLSLLALACAAARAGDEAPARSDASRVAPGVWSSADGSKITYEASYFEPYQTVTAADLLRWVPGGTRLVPDDRMRFDEEDKRGFGSGGDQILINGRRLSGKANDIGSALRRIRADAVLRVEVIRGTTSGLDVRSEGTLINLVLSAEAAGGGAGTWQLHSAFYGRDEPEFDGLVSYSDSAAGINYLVSAQYGPYNRGNQVERFDEFFAPVSGELTERREIEVPMLDTALILNGSANATFANGDVLNVNARILDRESEEDETTRVFIVGNPATTELRNLARVDALEWELGGDYERRLGPGSLKSRFIFTRADEDDSERVSLTSTDPANVPAESLIETAAVATEAILRGSYTWEPRVGGTLELGAEGARNRLEKDVALFEVLPDGSLLPVDVFNANSDVVEDRYELFTTWFRPLTASLALESAVNVEFSTIGQQGLDVDNSRSFTYVKPRFDLRWDLDDATQLRATLERTVSQLDFADFVASFDNDNDQVDAGNPDLEPEQAWEYRLAWERRLANDRGLLEAQVFFNDVEDHIDNIRATGATSVAGNIGDAEIYGLTLKGSLRLAALGLEGAVLDASWTLQDSETTDPFTGETREMSDRQRQQYSVNFRHDIPAWRFAYNVELEYNGKRRASDINFRETATAIGPRTNIGMQYRLTDRVLLWLDNRIIFDSHNRRIRDRFVGDVADGVLLRREVRNQFFRPEFSFGLRGQF